jgi:hypothetical protein
MEERAWRRKVVGRWRRGVEKVIGRMMGAIVVRVDDGGGWRR